MGFFFFIYFFFCQREIAPKRARHLQTQHRADGWGEGQAGLWLVFIRHMPVSPAGATRLLGAVPG